MKQATIILAVLVAIVSTVAYTVYRIDRNTTVHTGGAFASLTNTVNTVLSITGQGVETISIATSTPTSTLTTAQVCGNSYHSLVATITTGTITFPAATSTNAACLTTNGVSLTMAISNISSTASVVTIATSTGQTLVSNTSTRTITGGQRAIFTIQADTSSTEQVYELLLQ